MESVKISGKAGLETRVVILDSGEEAFTTLTKFANDAAITAASLTAIGAFERATVGWFDFEKKTYKKIEVAEQCEVLSAIGDIAVGDDGKASLHVHVVLGLADGTTRGGHLLEGKVRPTLEIVIADTPAHLRRKKEPDLGIALYRKGKDVTGRYGRRRLDRLRRTKFRSSDISRA
ncbi:putative DNA-binding protein with PD1-like motif [Bradyrhizobium sp. USDA 3311]